MATVQADGVLRHIRTLADQGFGRPPDAHLLQRFTEGDEEAAFAELVRRHGPLVLGVCRRVLGNHHDAEDAFQATFLALARKAGSIGRAASVGGWLYQVAYHTALRSRGRAARVRHEGLAEDAAVAPPSADPLAAVSGRELLAVLDGELQALPEQWRAPLVLCYLEGRTRDEAALELGWSLGTLKRRLEEGRDRLRDRLGRKGVGLPAALLAAGLSHAAPAVSPSLLVAAMRAALRRAGAGAGLGKLKAVGAALLAAGVLAVAAGALTPPSAGGRRAAASPAAAAPDDKEQKELALTVRVEDGDGKPLAGAAVALVGAQVARRLPLANPEEVLAQGKTDKDGKLTLKLAAAPAGYHRIHALAVARGHGLGWQPVSPRGADKPPAVTMKLAREQAIRGRMIDLQGQPARGVQARIVRVMRAPSGRRPDDRMDLAWRLQGGYRFPANLTAKDWVGWPAVVTTDADGRFSLSGFADGQEVDLLIDDDRFAVQEWPLKNDGTSARLALAAAQHVEGQVVFADTKKPAAGVWLNVSSHRTDRPGGFTRVMRSNNTVVATTDARGRYRVNVYAGESLSLSYFSPEGSAYLGVFKRLSWPKGAVKQTADVKLPRGVLVKGKVTEAASGKPIDHADLYYAPQTENNPGLPGGLLIGSYYKVYSKADGTFAIAVPAGKGHLLVGGPTRDFVSRSISEAQLRSGTPGGLPRYHHGVVALDLKTSAREKELAVQLRRGVTIRGQVVGPDGKAPKLVAMFCPGELMPQQQDVRFAGMPQDVRLSPAVLRDGTFELTNCDPDKTYRVCFLDAPRGFGGVMSAGPGGALRVSEARLSPNSLLEPTENRLGAVVALSAKKAAGKPVTVKLAPCGAAEITFKDDKGKPQRPTVWLELVVEDGPSVKRSMAKKTTAAETALLGHAWPGAGRPFFVDEKGRLGIPALIPGATYRLKAYDGTVLSVDEREVLFQKDFKAASGKTLKLGDATLTKPR